MTDSPQNSMTKLLRFLRRLDQDKIWYRLDRSRDPIMVIVTVPGERWEVEFFEDGKVEIERFVSHGVQVADDEMINLLMAKYEEPDLR